MVPGGVFDYCLMAMLCGLFLNLSIRGRGAQGSHGAGEASIGYYSPLAIFLGGEACDTSVHRLLVGMAHSFLFERFRSFVSSSLHIPPLAELVGDYFFRIFKPFSDI